MCCALLTDVQPCALPVCFELPVTMGGSSGYINGHVAACLPNFMIMEVGEGEIEDGVYNTDIKFEDGYAVLGDRPGTGVQIDYEALERQQVQRSEEHTSELQSLMRNSSAVFCLKNKKRVHDNMSTNLAI